MTLIHHRHLKALEDGVDADLPEPFYVKNFIRKYANALSLPGDAMANRYWDTRPLPEHPVKPPSAPDIMVPWWVFPALLGALLLGAIATFAVMNSGRAPSVTQSVAPDRGSHAAAAGSAGHATYAGATTSNDPGAEGQSQGAQGGAGLAGATGSALGGAPKIEAASRSGDATAAIAAVPTPPIPSPHPTASPQPLNMPPMVVPGHQISFKTFNKESAWMHIVADGREVHSGVMPKNMVRTWVAERSLVVKIGRPGVVSATLGDRPLGILGSKDAPVYRRTFYTQEGMGAQQDNSSGSQVARAGNRPATQRRAASPRPVPSPRPTPTVPAETAPPASEVGPPVDDDTSSPGE